MQALNNKLFVYLGGFVFIALLAVLLYAESLWYAVAAIPFVLLLIGLAFFSLDKLLLFIVFATPLSFNLEDATDFGIGVYLPTEPLMFGVMLLFFIKLIYEQKFDLKVMKHPITVAIVINIIWIAITVITSEMPLVSFKFLLSRLWFVITFYFLATQLFKKKSNMKKFVWLYIIPMLVVIGYTVIRHAGYGFEEKPGHWVMDPFFKDHTSYGAIMAMYFPFIVASITDKTLSINTRIIIGLVLVIFTIGLVFSYTRAAWVSLVFVLGVYLCFLLKIKFRVVALIVATAVGLFLFFQNDIIMALEKNDQDSSSNLTEHVQSIANVATDASNLERINRWSCAFRMFEERPVFGWGPGTYMFLYAPFQHSSQLTIISTNFGNKGNAHSEYFGPLAESGLLGGLTFLLIAITIVYKASYLYLRLKDKELKILVMSLLLGIITYLVHGGLNNFLDTDKASVPFWGFSAIIVVIDLYHEKKSENKLPESA